MADFTRLNRYRAELTKTREKRNELEGKIKELERRCREEENVAIRDIVREAKMSPEELAGLIGMSTADKLKTMNKRAETEEGEVSFEDDEDN